MNLSGIDTWLATNDPVDENNCDREAIHVPGSIQGHGALVVVDDSDNVCMSSSNAASMLGLEPPLVGADVLRALASDTQQSASWDIVLGGVSHSVVTHRIDSVRVFEIEPNSDASITTLISRISRATVDLAKARGSDELYDVIVQEIRELLQFDRVMAYRFERDGHGQVISEARSSRAASMLGLHFPATDIPQQARRLYTLQTSRLIADVHGHQEVLQPTVLPTTHRPLNMAFCELRSVSPIHIEYLKNMGVGASFSVSIVVDGELAGLIACHHNEPRHIDYRVRQGCEVLGRLASEHLAREHIERQRTVRNRQLSMQVDLLCELSEELTLSAHSKAWQRTTSFIDCDAVFVCYDGQQVVYGDSPPSVQEVWKAGNKLNSQARSACTNSERLSDVVGADVGGGLLVVGLGESGWLGWYRQPSANSVVWAGKPESPSEKSLTPRASFDAWVETLAGRCTPWSDADLEMSEILRRGLAARLGVYTADDDSFARAMFQLREYTTFLEESNQELQRMNTDLSQYAHAAAHDLRAPLRTVRSFLPLIQENAGDALSEDARTWLTYVGEAANTLHRLQEGLWAFSTVNGQSSVVDVDLNRVAQRAVDSLAADLIDADVHIGTLPVVRGIKAQMETLFQNLLENAGKYRSADRRLSILIDVRQNEGDSVVSITDNGIGFPPSASERIFDLFSRISANNSDGDGLGLALCRRIVHHHRGWISAFSEPDCGSTFEFVIREPRGKR